MDLSFLQSLVPDLAGFFHLQPATLLLYLVVISTICNIVGRKIPDSATGYLGVIREVCKIIGLYAANKVAPGVTVSDVAKRVLGDTSVSLETSEAIAELAGDPTSLIPEVVDAAAVKAFPRLQPRADDGKFTKKGPTDA